MPPEAFESEPTIKPGTREVDDRATLDDLAAVGSASQTGRMVDRHAVVLAVSYLQVASMNRDPNAQFNVARPVGLAQQRLQSCCGANGCSIANTTK